MPPVEMKQAARPFRRRVVLEWRKYCTCTYYSYLHSLKGKVDHTMYLPTVQFQCLELQVDDAVARPFVPLVPVLQPKSHCGNGAPRRKLMPLQQIKLEPLGEVWREATVAYFMGPLMAVKIS